MIAPSSLIELARKQARAAGLEPALVSAVCEQESAWNPWAIRYEPEFYLHYLLPLAVSGKLGGATEARARAFSWGLMQVMGETAREHGYGGHLAALCDPATGVEIGCRVLAAKLAAAQGDVRRALLAWNGGGDPGYPASVLARMRKYA
ncbi:MAG TPA: lytic transglycosylase domain-containing protein [Patescibacteria group bacterium]|nr:lytic transglycosylase domain-containing protein [Patescibacteria group bacterium]